MTLPRNCKSDKFCSLVGTLVGKSTVFSIQASIVSVTYLPITASIANVRLGRKITLVKAGLQIIGGANPSIGLTGEIHLRKPPLIFAATISISLKGLVLELSMTNCWHNAFGVKWLSVCNLLGAIAFGPSTGITGLEVGGEIHLGYKSTGKQIKAKGYIGINTMTPVENYYYVKFSRATLGSLLQAFKVKFRLPRPLAESGFPKGFLSSFSILGKELPQVHVSIPIGFRLKGTFNILGLEAMADITIGLPRGIDIKVALPPIKIGGLLQMFASPRERRKGPLFRAKVQLLPRPYVHIEARGYLMVLGMSLEARLKISNTQYEYFIRGKILHLFQAKLHITARYGSLRNANFRVRGEFQLDLFRGIQNFVKSAINTVANVARRAFDAAKRVFRQMKRLWTAAMKKFNWARNKLKRLLKGIFLAQVMEASCYGRRCKNVSIQGWGSITRAVKRVGRRAYRGVKRAGRRVYRGTVRVGRRVYRRAKKTIVKGISAAARRLTAAAKYVYNKAKRAFDWAKRRYHNAKNALNKVKNAFRTGLKLLNYIRKRGLGGIISIRKIWFDTSLGAANGGRFSCGVNVVFFGKYHLKFRLEINLRSIGSIAKKLVQKIASGVSKFLG